MDGMRVDLDACRMGKRMEAHAYLKDKFGFFDDYGGNLDALHDCLTALAAEVVIENKDMAGEYFRKIYQVFLDAARENPNLILILPEKKQEEMWEEKKEKQERKEERKAQKG